MNGWLNELIPSALESWQNMTLMDYGNAVLAVVVLGWALSRRT